MVSDLVLEFSGQWSVGLVLEGSGQRSEVSGSG